MRDRRLSRLLAACAASLALWSGLARADTVESNIRQLGESSYKLRLSAALALGKSHDPRAVIALADLLDRDEEATIRRVAALALGKMIDAQTAPDAIALAGDALDTAASTDGDSKVRDTANKARVAIASFRKSKRSAAHGDKGGAVFVNIDSPTDLSRVAPAGTSDRLTGVVKRYIERTGYATSWPGGLPTQTELSNHHARAFIVASSVKKIEVAKASGQTQITCKVEIRVAPWEGKDIGEHWEANRAASASGSAKALTGNTDREIQSGMRDCLEAVAEDVTSRQVVPFLKHLATPGS